MGFKVKYKCPNDENVYDPEELNELKKLNKYSGLCESCRTKAIKLDDRLRRMTYEEICQEIEEKFKNMETYEDLRDIIFYQENSFEAPYFEFRSKRKNTKAFAFSRNRNNPDRVDYLYDGITLEGSCLIKEMDKYLKIRFYK